MAPSFATAEAPDTLPAVKPVKVDGHQPVQVDDSTARRVRNNELAELKIAEEMGAPDVYVDSEKDTCWYLWTGSIYCKVLRVENRTGLYVIALKTGPHAELGKHRHRGEVRAYTVGDGHWGYHEYGWKANKGDYICENPGTIHTLWMGENSEVLFNVMGSIEFFNEDNTLRETMDGFSFWRMYLEHCEQNGLTPNKSLFY